MITPPDRPDGRTPDSMCEFFIYMTGFSTDFWGGGERPGDGLER